MPRLIPATRPDDDRRAHRLLIAWVTGDAFACDVVLGEAADDPLGTPGLLFALAEYATQLGERCVPDFAEALRANLLRAGTEG